MTLTPRSEALPVPRPTVRATCGRHRARHEAVPDCVVIIVQLDAHILFLTPHQFHHLSLLLLDLRGVQFPACRKYRRGRPYH
jgi:hypothetical protein